MVDLNYFLFSIIQSDTTLIEMKEMINILHGIDIGLFAVSIAIAADSVK